MKIADVVIRQSNENGELQSPSVRIVPLEVTSLPTESSLIPLDVPITLHSDESIVAVLSVQRESVQRERAEEQLPNLTAIDHAKLKEYQRLEFVRKKFQIVAVVEHTPAESGARQIGLVPLREFTHLPAGAKLVGAIESPGYAVSAQDGETGQKYFLGYGFEDDDRVNWVQLAFARRKEWKTSSSGDRVENGPADSPAAGLNALQSVACLVREQQNAIDQLRSMVGSLLWLTTRGDQNKMREFAATVWQIDQARPVGEAARCSLGT